MKTKEQILSLSKNNFKPIFLLAWLRFLTYAEMENLDILEPYDAAIAAHQIKSKKDWDNLVIDFTKENLLCGLCILMRKLYNAISHNDNLSITIYADDIQNWLIILDDEEFKINKFEDKIEYYNKISKKYKIEF